MLVGIALFGVSRPLQHGFDAFTRGPVLLLAHLIKVGAKPANMTLTPS
jgi:hypothetical protein